MVCLLIVGDPGASTPLGLSVMQSYGLPACCCLESHGRCLPGTLRILSSVRNRVSAKARVKVSNLPAVCWASWWVLPGRIAGNVVLCFVCSPREDPGEFHFLTLWVTVLSFACSPFLSVPWKLKVICLPCKLRILSSVRVRINIRTEARVGLTFFQLSVGDPGRFYQLGFWLM